MSAMSVLYGCYESVIMGSTGAIRVLDERYDRAIRILRKRYYALDGSYKGAR